MRMRLWTAVALAAVITITGVGCATHDDTEDPYKTGSGIGEEGLGGEGSLQQYQQGRLGGTESGPLKDVRFDYDSYDLREDARIALRDNAAWLQANAGARVEIEGHCDERGTVEYNLALGAKRARAAKDYLVALGVADQRMTTISYGEELPLCYDHTEACWQMNRRVHFVVRGE